MTTPTADITKALLWQHNKAFRLQSLIEQKQAWYDKHGTGFWDDWEKDVFDLRTCNTFGLSVWAIILDLPLDVISPDAGRPIWGFNVNAENFNHGNFLGVSSGLVYLGEEALRIVLRLRYFQLATNCSVTEINKFLLQCFPYPVWVVDNLDMSATYYVGARMSDQFKNALLTLDVLPRPAGVRIEIIPLFPKRFAWDVVDTARNGWDLAEWMA